MSMLGLRSREPKMPRANNVPPTVIPPDHRNYSEEALRVAQRAIDDQLTIQSLSHERDEWQRRALSAEGEVDRLHQQVKCDRLEALDEAARVKNENAVDLAKLQHELDYVKDKCARIMERLHISAQVILDALKEDEVPKPDAQAAVPKVDMSAFAAELEKTVQAEEPMPAVVISGPREG